MGLTLKFFFQYPFAADSQETLYGLTKKLLQEYFHINILFEY